MPRSPCFHYLQWQWRPAMERAGFGIDLTLERAGFFPKGGGLVEAQVTPPRQSRPLMITDTGPISHIRGLSAVARLPATIARRQRSQAMARLAGTGIPAEIVEEEWASESPGTVLILQARGAVAGGCYFALGARGKPAEVVADEAADHLLAFIKSGAAIDRHLADQLLLPLSFVQGRSELHCETITAHLATNAEVVRQFHPVPITLESLADGTGCVVIEGRPASR